MKPHVCYCLCPTQGVPAGPCSYTCVSQRTLDMDKFAAAHILAPEGPTLTVVGQYDIPAGSGDDPKLVRGGGGRGGGPGPGEGGGV